MEAAITILILMAFIGFVAYFMRGKYVVNDKLQKESDKKEKIIIGKYVDRHNAIIRDINDFVRKAHNKK